MAQQNKSQSKVKTGLARCLELASGHKGLVFLSGVLAALAAICSFVPYLSIYYIIREILFVYPDMSLLNVSTISTWGWLALVGILGNIVFYFFAFSNKKTFMPLGYFHKCYLLFQNQLFQKNYLCILFCLHYILNNMHVPTNQVQLLGYTHNYMVYLD